MGILLAIYLTVQSMSTIDATISNLDLTNIHKCEWGSFALTQQEYELICRTVCCEAGNQDLETQKMVALTILNRLQSGEFGETISEIILAENAYEATRWNGFESRMWTQQVQKAVDYALKENNYPSNMYYFRTEHFHKFGKPYVKSGDLYFSTKQRLRREDV